MLDSDVPQLACIRGLLRKLQSRDITESHIQVVPDSLVRWDEIVDSPSYQSLTTQYSLYQLTVSSSR
jgi:hypothetical protein